MLRDAWVISIISHTSWIFFHCCMHSLTLEVLKLLTDGFMVLRIDTDNHPSNVSLFKNLSGAALKNCIEHPFLPIPAFLYFDYCHALKNARNLFLDHDMNLSAGIISSTYLKRLYGLQKGWSVKAVRYLTKKHLYPTNFDKIHIVSSTV